MFSKGKSTILCILCPYINVMSCSNPHSTQCVFYLLEALSHIML